VTPRQRGIVLALSIGIALTRLPAIAASFLDWDEALFISGVRDFDVSWHHPHPPGYPLFVGAAKIVHLFGVDEFRALQAIVVVGAWLLFPALFALARELGFDFATSCSGAAIFAFLPNVWLYGGTAFSDIPAATLTFAACALLLRGRRDVRAYVLGAVVLGIAAGMRTPSLLVGAVPGLLATWQRVRARQYGTAIAAMLLGAAIVLASYGGAALASSSVAGYLDALRAQREYVRDVDSWRNPVRGPLRDAFVTFLIHPFQHRDVLNGLAIASGISLLAAAVRRHAAPWLTVAMFAPLALAACFNFDVNAAARYAVGYMAVHALLAADGFRVLFRRGQVAFCAITIAVLVYVMRPVLYEQRTAVAPAVAALRHADALAPPAEPLYVHGSMRPHAEALLPRRELRIFIDYSQVPPGAMVVDERLHPGATLFVRPRRATWKVLRRRNFEAAVLRK
jgi:hypothetical protein